MNYSTDKTLHTPFDHQGEITILVIREGNCFLIAEPANVLFANILTFKILSESFMALHGIP